MKFKLNKNYEQLKLMLGIEGFEIKECDNSSVASVFGPHLSIKGNDLVIYVYQQQPSMSLKLSVIKEINEYPGYKKLEEKIYKTPKGIFNEIKKVLNK